MNKITIYLLLFFVSKFLSCLPQNEVFWQSLTSSLDEIRQETDAKVETLVKDKVLELDDKVQTSVAGLRSEALQKVDKIKQNLKKDITEVQSDAEQEISEIAKDSEEELDDVKQEFGEQVDDVNKKALTEIVALINEAEEIAFKMSQEKREKVILDKLQQTFETSQSEAVKLKDLNGSLLMVQVPSYWKKQVSQDFYKNSAKLEQIVLEAESPEQATDFINCFKSQKEWFDKTLSCTNYTSDPGYSKIVRKKEIIDNMAMAIKRAEEYLSEWSDVLTLSEAEINKIKLLFLYDINSEMMRLQDLPVRVKTFTDDQIKFLTLKITNDVTNRVSKAFPDVDIEKIEYSNVPKNMRILAKVKDDLSDLKVATSKKRFDSQSLEDFLKKLNSDLSDLSVQVYDEGQKREHLTSEVESLKKDSLKKVVVAKKIQKVFFNRNKEMKHLKAEIDQTKKLLNELKLRNRETNNKVELIENFTEYKLKEQIDALKKKFANVTSERLKQQEGVNRQLIEKEITQRSSVK